MRRSAALAAVVTILAAAPVACAGGNGPPPARLSVQGLAEVTGRGQSSPRQVDGDRGLELGDRVRVVDGSAVVRLGGGRQLDLRPGSTVELAAGPLESVRPELVEGPLLVTASGQPVTVMSTGGEILVTGAARVSRTITLTVATYRGSTEVTSAGRTLSVPVFRQITVPAAGLLPGRVSPVEYVASDPWDQRLLGDAVDLGAQLVAKSRGFTSQIVPGEYRTAAQFRRLLPGLEAEPAFDSVFDPARPAGETLVGAAIVLEGRTGTFEERWRSVFGFRGDGADWGFVALDQGVDGSSVLRLIDSAIGRAPTPVFAGGTVPPTTRPPTPATVPPGRTSTTAPAAPVATTTIPTLLPAPPTTTPGALNTGAPVLDNTVNSLLDALTGLLRGLGSG